jgi:hypothetical protein
LPAAPVLTRSQFLALLEASEVLDTATANADADSADAAPQSGTAPSQSGSSSSSSSSSVGLSHAEAGRVFDLLDDDGDGVVSVDRCAEWWRSGSGSASTATTAIK